jgi:hypothetical protein
VELPDNDGIKSPTVRIRHEAVQFATVFLTTGNPDIYVLLGDRPSPTLAELTKFAQLHFRRGQALPIYAW